ncbi:uncharacterized protein [Mytilus edulis]|uniref:uncharacterized protein n=1 Tax=Mytilus edulis TaxID=6550 RepID=UPI0039EFFBF9
MAFGVNTALVGVILKRTTVDLRRVLYTVRVVRRIKGNVGAVGSEFNFETALTSAACGVSYPIGAMEFLMGSENRIGLCNLLFPTTFENWFYLLTSGRNSYIRNCKCKVLEEFETSPPMSYKLSNNSTEKECYRKTAICRRAQGGTCEWKNDDQCP